MSRRGYNQLELKQYRDNLQEIGDQRAWELALTQEVTIYSLEQALDIIKIRRASILIRKLWMPFLRRKIGSWPL